MAENAKMRKCGEARAEAGIGQHIVFSIEALYVLTNLTPRA